MRSALFASLVILTAVSAPLAFAGVTWVASYTGADENCRLSVLVYHKEPTDTRTPLVMRVATITSAPDLERLEVGETCGTFNAVVHCNDLHGSFDDGFHCLSGSAANQISVGGARDAPSPAPGVYAIDLVFYGHVLRTTATSSP